jgi:NitT/TauT family transport system substrate-binding protein
MAERTLPIVTISPNPPVFDLPVLVAQAEGLFARAGVEVRFSAPYEQRSQTERDVVSRLKEAHFENKSADVFNFCEWGSFDRLERSTRGGRIAAWRAAVAAQAILSFDPTLQEPRDLANVPVAVNEFTGSHYTVLQLLEGAIKREEIVIEHIGAPENRYAQLKARTIRAAMVMEPFISLGLKDGAHIIGLTFYRGSEVISPDLAAPHREAYLRAIDGAVDLINADRAKYKHFVVAPTRGALAPNELFDAYFRYVHVQPYPLERFTQAYEWVKSWGLTPGEKDFDSLVLS